MRHNDDGIQVVVNVNVNVNGKSITGGNNYEEASDEVQAAIATALYQYLNEGGMTVRSGSTSPRMQNQQQTSAWANKGLTLRRMPGQW
ncbi:hypothetical protein QYZ87_04615 [Porphyromonadaceae bacterium W3.11]|nr:hypothetical protein [Porphyromonadaceae bacterium W3.11]